MTTPLPAMGLPDLRAAYGAGVLTPADVLQAIHHRIAEEGAAPVWISLQSVEAALAKLAAAEASGRALPLRGIPFAVKDNIDVAGLETTAACPAFAYRPDKSATVVERLEAAGAMVIGKTNLDQFATGLVGTRSPYGVPSNVFDPAYISGGSSSGSAVAVGSGLVSFSLGTDTAGSGRVPASFNNIVGLKPTPGLISTAGMVPACQSLDCVSIFAGSVGEAMELLKIAAAPDPADPYSRVVPADYVAAIGDGGAFRFGVPTQPLEFFGDEQAKALHEAAVERLRALGGQPVGIDYAPFSQVVALLYQGPWTGERLAALRAYGFDRWDAMDPTVATIIRAAEKFDAAATFAGFHELERLKRVTEQVWQSIDVLVLPTAGTIYTIAALQADPITLNSNLGRYTNFVNFLGLSAIAVPAGFRPNGLPYGVTLIGRPFADTALAPLAQRLHETLPDAKVGATGRPVPPVPIPQSSTGVVLAVVGAHLEGQPLNFQLTSRGARKLETTRSATGYQLLALAGTVPAKPGLVRKPGHKGRIELELWALSEAAFGNFVAEVPPPMAIGTIELEDGRQVKGFLCEPVAIDGARDITEFGGWRNFLSLNSTGS